jgi:predicted ATPase
MIERLYIHNFRCLENFELVTKGMPTALLIGGNGSGKSSVRQVLEILQRVGRGTNRVGELVRPEDFARGRADVPIRIEIETRIAERVYKYVLALELPRNFKELRVYEEQLIAGDAPVYSRSQAQVTVPGGPGSPEAKFLVDWHLVALSVIQNRSDPDDLSIFKTWLARTVILAPIPILMSGDSADTTLEPDIDGTNFGAWLSGLLARYPAAYSQIENYLREVMPDFGDIQQVPLGPNVNRMTVSFKTDQASMKIAFKALSDGEKCFLLTAVVLAANKAYGPLFCFWDEPDNYLSLSEVGQFVMYLRRAFGAGGQLLATSHNPEAIRKFSDENTFLLHRNCHLDPTQARRLDDLSIPGDLVDALIRGDVHP